jgi:hypothetical protein
MATTVQVTLRSTVAPRLPSATPEYDQSMLDAENNILRLYFAQLDNFTQSLLSSSGSKFLSAPYGAFSSDQSQTTTANTATLMTLNTTDFSNGVTINTSKITVAAAGIYNLQFSAQIQNLDNAPQDVFIWLKQNGTDIVGSTGKVGISARKSAGVPSHDIEGWNYFVSMAANDYIEIYWSPTIATVTIEYYVASGTPTKPSTQSVVATMSFVSALPA